MTTGQTIGLILAIALIMGFVYFKTDRTKLFFTQSEIVTQAPVVSIGEYDYVPQPQTYDNKLCQTFKTMSSPELELTDPTMVAPRPLDPDETTLVTTAVQKFVNKRMDMKSVFKVMDTAGSVAKGLEVDYFEITATLWNSKRFVATPIHVEMFLSEGNFQVRNFRANCTFDRAFGDKKVEPKDVVHKYSDGVTYPPELQMTIARFQKEATKELQTLAPPPETHYEPLGTFASGINETNNPSDVLRNYNNRKR